MQGEVIRVEEQVDKMPRQEFRIQGKVEEILMGPEKYDSVRNRICNAWLIGRELKVQKSIESRHVKIKDELHDVQEEQAWFNMCQRSSFGDRQSTFDVGNMHKGCEIH